MALGLAGAVAVGRVLEKLLIQTSATDPAVNLTGLLMLCAATVLACMIPAWKASHLDPLSALRVRR
jgi:putative ABC transport system permease protein